MYYISRALGRKQDRKQTTIKLIKKKKRKAGNWYISSRMQLPDVYVCAPGETSKLPMSVATLLCCVPFAEEQLLHVSKISILYNIILGSFLEDLHLEEFIHVLVICTQ